MKRWKSFICVLIALWLPLQGYGAVAMPFCQHDMAGASVSPEPASQHHDGHAGMQHDDSGASPSGATDQAGGLGCNNCGACHLACAPAISAMATVCLLIARPVLQSTRADSAIFFYPEQPQHPPLSALIQSAG